jgi:hypothetical protein
VLTADENETLTRIGPGTRMGNLWRRYWQPFAATSEFADRWTMRVRLLGEDLVAFKDRSGKMGFASLLRRTRLRFAPIAHDLLNVFCGPKGEQVA